MNYLRTARKVFLFAIYGWGSFWVQISLSGMLPFSPFFSVPLLVFLFILYREKEISSLLSAAFFFSSASLLYPSNEQIFFISFFPAAAFLFGFLFFSYSSRYSFLSIFAFGAVGAAFYAFSFFAFLRSIFPFMPLFDFLLPALYATILHVVVFLTAAFLYSLVRPVPHIVRT